MSQELRPEVIPIPYRKFFLKITHISETILSILTKLCPNVPWVILIYGLGVGISTIKKFTSGRGWGMTTRGLSNKLLNLPSHPDYKYIWFRGGDLNH
jgi:hypothetical protein